MSVFYSFLGEPSRKDFWLPDNVYYALVVVFGKVIAQANDEWGNEEENPSKEQMDKNDGRMDERDERIGWNQERHETGYDAKEVFDNG